MFSACLVVFFSECLKIQKQQLSTIFSISCQSVLIVHLSLSLSGVTSLFSTCFESAEHQTHTHTHLTASEGHHCDEN